MSHGNHVDDFAFLILLATEHHDAIDQLRRFIGRLDDAVEVLLVELALLQFHHCQFGVTGNARQNIVKVVSNAAGQRADGLHFL